jgi:polyisoprenyl-teichoic acid--peptidoglycan teichoic acid transferase
MRLDPETEAVSVLSVPRDLWLPIAGTDDEGRINSAYTEPGQQQVLIDTIHQNLGIEINHWIEVDFQGFRELVDSIGGVTLYFDRPLRDRESGLIVEQLGCVTLDGDMALAYARSRKAQYFDGDSWVRDPQSDLSRIVRQQNLMAAALREALDDASNPMRLRDLIGVGTDNVSIDSGLDLDDIGDLANSFKDMDTDRFQTASLPVEPRPGDEEATVVIDAAAAQPLLNVFRGVDPREVSASLVTVDVQNGTAADPAREREGLAGEVALALEGVGFRSGPPDDAPEFHEHTTVRYAPGELTFGQRVARQLETGVVLEEDEDVESGHVTVVAGADFTTVLPEPVAVEDLPPSPAGASTTATTATTEPPTTAGEEQEPSPTSFPSSSTTTTPAQVGGVPDGAC